MKKLCIICLSIIFLITFQSTPISALKSKKAGVQTFYNSDGSYLEITYKEYKQPFKSLKNSRKKVFLCIKSNIYTSCPSKTWRIVKQTSYRSGNAATGTATAKKYSNKHFVIHTIKKVLSLRCAPSGQLY